VALNFNPSGYFEAWKIGRANEEGPDLKSTVTDPLLKGFESLAERDSKKKDLLAKRQEQGLELALKLKDQGLQPDEVNNVVNNFISTGSLELPSMRAKVVGNEPDIGPISSGVEPIKYGKPEKQKRLYAFDKGTNQWTEKVVPEGVDPETVSYDSTPAAPVPFFMLDPESGTMRQVGAGPKGSKVVTPPSEPAAKEDPTLKAQRDLFKKTTATIEKLQADGEDVPDALIAQANELAAAVGLEPQEQVTKPAGWFSDEQKRTVYKPKGTTAPPPAKYESAGAVKLALKAGQLSRDQAVKILRNQFGMK